MQNPVRTGLLIPGLLLALNVIPGGVAEAGRRSDRNKADCLAWCGAHGDEGCHHCSATSACGAGYSDMRKFGTLGTWYACRLNDFGQRGERNHQECEAFCRENAACVECSSTPCGRGIKLLKAFTGSGKDWYACEKTNWARNTEESHAAAVQWCSDYRQRTGEECRIVRSGHSCPDGFYKSDRITTSWGRDHKVCLQSKSGSQRVKDCSGRAAGNIERALAWIEEHYDTIATDFRMQPGSYRNRRAHARMDRKFPDVTVQCEDDRQKCQGTVLGWSAAGRWVNLCYDRHRRFCQLVGTIVHESGHNAWVDQELSQHIGDPGPQNDTVYQFGFRAEDLCTGANRHGTNVVPAGSRSYDFDLN